MAHINGQFNFNTLLLAILVGGAGWNLNETIAAGRSLAALTAAQKQINEDTRRQLDGIYQRLKALENKP